MENAAYIIVMFIVEKRVHCIALEGRLLSYMLKLILKGVEFLVKRKRKKMKNVTLIIQTLDSLICILTELSLARLTNFNEIPSTHKRHFAKRCTPALHFRVQTS